jgi:predicted nucleotidyltransferase
VWERAGGMASNGAARDGLAAAIATAVAAGPSEVVSVYLFGSHADGPSHRESDIDVGVLVPWATYATRVDRFEARVRLTSHLIGALHENEVDVVVLNDAPPLLGRRIVSSGIRVHLADPEADHAYGRRPAPGGGSRAVAAPDAASQARGHLAVMCRSL